MSREQVTIGAVVDVKASVTSLKDLKGIIDDAKIALEGLDSDSKDYKTTLETLAQAQGEYNKVLEATKDSQKNMSSTIEGITNVTNGMMGGFQALNGVLALTGTENKNLVETLVKLKAVSSVVQGFKQFTDAIKAGNTAFKLFNITVKSNPLMLLATSIITVIALVKQFTSSLGEANEEIRDLDKDIQIRIDKNTDFFNNKMKRYEDEINKEKELAKARGASAEELLEYDRKIYENRKKIYDKAIELYEISEAFNLIFKYPDKSSNELEQIKTSYDSILKVYKDAMKMINEAKDSASSSEIIESLEDQEEYITNLFLNLPKKVRDPVNDLEKEVMESFGRMGLSGKATYKDVLLKTVVVANDKIFSIVDKNNHKAIDSFNNMSETASELFVETLNNANKIQDIIEKEAINESEFKHKEAVITTEIETKKREEANKTYLDNKKRRESELKAAKENADDLIKEFQNIQGEGAKAIKEMDKDISMSLAHNSNEYINILKERITELDIDNEGILQKISSNIISKDDIANDPKKAADELSKNIEMQNRYNNEILKQKALEAELKSIIDDRLNSEKDNLEVLSAIEKDKIDAREAARQAGLAYQDMDTQLEQFEQEQSINQAKAEMFLELANDEATSWEIRAEAIQSYDEYNKKSLQAFVNAEKTKKQLTDRRKQIEKSAFNSTRSITYNTMDILNESIGNSKAGAIAKTTIDTYASATEAYRSQLPLGPKGPILGGLAAAAAITAGLKNVKAIMRTETPGSKGGGSSSGGGITQPDYLDNNPQITEQFVKMTSDDIDEINKSSRVYVVESDISNTQNKVKTTEGQATF